MARSADDDTPTLNLGGQPQRSASASKHDLNPLQGLIEWAEQRPNKSSASRTTSGLTPLAVIGMKGQYISENSASA